MCGSLAAQATYIPRLKPEYIRLLFHHAEAWCFHLSYPSTFTRTIFLPARRVNSEPSFTEATRSFLSSPSTLTAFCLTLREPSETDVANPAAARSLSRRTWTVTSVCGAFVPPAEAGSDSLGPVPRVPLPSVAPPGAIIVPPFGLEASRFEASSIPVRSLSDKDSAEGKTALGAATSANFTVTSGRSSGVSSFWNIRDQSVAACSAAA